jgi:myo-inositol 2-dehydrogenase / D-chiro-inositol 1-dehydrogenase
MHFFRRLPAMEKVKLGIIGLGRLGFEHAKNIYYNIPQAELTAICSVVDEELERVRNEMDPEYVTADYKELIAVKELDGIVIATNSATHCEIICYAAEHGMKHIYTEKPLGMSLQEIDQIKDTVTRNNVALFQVGYNHRFDKDLQEAKKKVEEGFIGNPILIRMASRDQAGLEEFLVKFAPTSGGLVADMLTHDYDTARWFTNSEAETIYGIGGVYAYEGLKTVGDIDNTVILMKFRNGVMVQLEASRNSAYGYHAPMEIYGSRGSIKIGENSFNSRTMYLNETGVARQCSKWFFEYWQDTYFKEIEDFVSCILTGSSPKVDLIDGYKAVEWALKAAEAVDTETVIRM